MKEADHEQFVSDHDASLNIANDLRDFIVVNLKEYFGSKDGLLKGEDVGRAVYISLTSLQLAIISFVKMFESDGEKARELVDVSAERLKAMFDRVRIGEINDEPKH